MLKVMRLTRAAVSDESCLARRTDTVASQARFDLGDMDNATRGVLSEGQPDVARRLGIAIRRANAPNRHSGSVHLHMVHRYRLAHN
jgi:hypothetical protein